MIHTPLMLSLVIDRDGFLPPTPPTAIIPAIVADISTIVPQFTAILPNLAPITRKLVPAGAVVQITQVLAPVPVELTPVPTNLMTIMPGIRGSRRSQRNQAAENQGAYERTFC